MIDDFLTIKNADGQIIETNYWNTVYAKNGRVYVSLNAGHYRLLIPNSMKDNLKDMSTAKVIVISRGAAPMLIPPKDDGFQIMFDDGSDAPYIITTGTEYWDRYPGDEDLGWNGIFDVYMENNGKPVLEFYKVYYRKVETLPCLNPAGEE